MKKKILSLIIALTLSFSLSLSAFASPRDASNPTEPGGHNYTSWQSLGYRTEPAPSLLYCFTYIDIQYRYCVTCNDTQIREDSMLMYHTYVETGDHKTCQVCGWTIETAK